MYIIILKKKEFYKLLMVILCSTYKRPEGGISANVQPYSAINGRQATQEEIDLASGKTIFDPSKHSNFIKSIQVSQLDICHALQNKANVAAVS